MSQIRYFCAKCPNLEWAGITFYQVESGGLDNPSEMVMRVDRVLPMIIDSAGSFSFDVNGGEVLRYVMENALLEHRQGLIHSHHTMGVTFSSTDHEELAENGPNHAFYLSIVVNNRMDFSAWLAYPTEQRRKMKHLDMETTEEVIIKHECEVSMHAEKVDGYSVKRFEKLWQDKKAKQVPAYGTASKYGTTDKYGRGEKQLNFWQPTADEDLVIYARRFFFGSDHYDHEKSENAFVMMERRLAELVIEGEDGNGMPDEVDFHDQLMECENMESYWRFHKVKSLIRQKINMYSSVYPQASEFYDSVLRSYDAYQSISDWDFDKF